MMGINTLLFYPYDSCFIINILFYPQSAFYPWSAVCSLQFAFYTDWVEISMFVIQINNSLKDIKECKEDFGGVSIIAIGDLFQLEPVIF